MGVLAEFLESDGIHIQAASEKVRVEKLNWQRAVQELVDQFERWLTEVEPKEVVRYHRGVVRIEDDYDVGVFELATFSIVLGRNSVRITPTHVPVVGRIEVPGEDQHRKVAGRVDFDNGTERRHLYYVRRDERDVWLWWGHGGVGIPFDRESFETAVVSLLR